ncbi:MAG TPA: presqualene diphosphate synthase HpnD [Acidimicrobiales bacterium]|nr:presqualene diphosphate synthase HpnD [Acidimicrobiales bacterium]
MNVEEAYRRCEAITRAEARNFAYGIALLPAQKRRAMSALYAMARRIDDIGDGTGDPADRLESLAGVRKSLHAIAAEPAAAGDDPVLVALADVARRYPLPMGALDELVEGCEMDVAGTTYPTFADLVGYCRRVAGTVGRLSLAVYGCDDHATAEPLADALGIALQLTNIVRDIVEDRGMGRVYLPGEDLQRFGVAGDASGPRPALVALVCFETARAEEWYERGLPLLDLLDRRSRACTAAMAGIYRRLLEAIRRRPESVLDGRVSLSPGQKALVAATALAGGHP